MAEAEVVKTTKIIFTLDEAEARILMAMIQNPIVEDEDRDSRRFRHDLFTLLRESGIKPL